MKSLSKPLNFIQRIHSSVPFASTQKAGPSTVFPTLTTIYSFSHLEGLFHPSATGRISMLRIFPATQPVSLLSVPFPHDLYEKSPTTFTYFFGYPLPHASMEPTTFPWPSGHYPRLQSVAICRGVNPTNRSIPSYGFNSIRFFFKHLRNAFTFHPLMTLETNSSM
jgi:hypothetical protein